jgi:amidase
MTEHITELSVLSLSEAIHQRRVTCALVMEAYLSRIAKLNPTFNALVSLRDEPSLLAQARAHDELLQQGTSLGWLHGIPQAIKDLANTAGLRTTLGSPLMANFVPQEDGLMVQRMKAAGAIVMGKTNVPEFGLGSHTFNEVFGATGNAYDPAKTSGGSSGGAAVALALRLLPVADGSDFGGSLRNPAAWNNVFGLRPSQGRVPMWPAQEVWLNQMGIEGPMGRSVADVRALLQTQAGFDARSPLSLATDSANISAAQALKPRPGAARVRVGWLGDLGGYLPLEPGLLQQHAAGLDRMRQMGCEVVSLSIEDLGFDPSKVWQSWLVWRRMLVASRLQGFLVQPSNRALMKPEALWEYDQAQSCSGHEFMQASVVRSHFYQALCKLLARFDVLALPCTQVWPFDIAERWPQHIAGRAMDTYHRWMEVVTYATLAGLPAMSVPSGFGVNPNIQGAKPMPCGLQIIGQPQGDWRLLDFAQAYEAQIQDWLSIRPAAVA